MKALSVQRVRQLLRNASRRKIVVLGDVMLDQFVWGQVNRISPEAPVPVVEFDRESYMPGGAANVARNLTSLGGDAAMCSIVGEDAEGLRLKKLLTDDRVDCRPLFRSKSRQTGIKTRIVAQQQQIVRLDKELRSDLTDAELRRIFRYLKSLEGDVSAIIVGDYGKGLVTQRLLEQLKTFCLERQLWLSVDPKPVHLLDLSGFSLLTPNRREAFALAGCAYENKHLNPKEDTVLLHVAETLLDRLKPRSLLITLGELGMLICEKKKTPFHIPTLAQDVFDVSGAGDTVIGAFTLAIAAGATAREAAMFSNHVAGVVVGKMGTATVSKQELLDSFK
jgi:rfaE bifunctional protein kinase chain/domain